MFLKLLLLLRIKMKDNFEAQTKITKYSSDQCGGRLFRGGLQKLHLLTLHF